jgi:hypothetical protein
VISYRARLDVPREPVQFVARLLAAERRPRGTPRGSRALSCLCQAVLGVRWFRDRATPDALARDHRISRATAYRYRDEVIDVLAEQAPDLNQALQRAHQDGLPHVILDGTIIESDRCREPASAPRARLSTCGTPGKRTPTAAASRPSSPRTASRCRPRGPSRARCTTSPPPAPTRSPRCTPPPQQACRPWPTRDMTEPGSPSTSRCASRPAAGTSISIPAPQRPPAVAALPGRTRVRTAHRPLAGAEARHRQPQQDRRHRPRGPRPHPFRARLHHINPLITSASPTPAARWSCAWR